MSKRKPYYEIVRTAAGWHTRLIAGNGQVVTTSETYTRKAAALRSIEIQRSETHDLVQVVDERV